MNKMIASTSRASRLSVHVSKLGPGTGCQDVGKKRLEVGSGSDIARNPQHHDISKGTRLCLRLQARGASAWTINIILAFARNTQCYNRFSCVTRRASISCGAIAATPTSAIFFTNLTNFASTKQQQKPARQPPLASPTRTNLRPIHRAHITRPQFFPPPFIPSLIMFFRRRSRANSYIDNDPPSRSQSYDDYEKHDKQPESSRNSQPVTSPTEEKEMYPRQSAPQETYSRGMQNGGHNAMPAMGNPTPPLTAGMTGVKPEPMPDLLAQAFNQAVRPYTEKIEQLESQLAEMQAWVEQLEHQRAEVHSWIDKRGLRPGM